MPSGGEIMPEFFRVVTPSQVFAELASFRRIGSQRVWIEDALLRVLDEEVIAEEDLPPSPRSTMDGYAVSAADTFGASASLPSFHMVVGHVQMGVSPEFQVGAGEAAEIPTGGFLPAGTDAVVMVEFTNVVGDGTIEVVRPVTVGENVLGRGEDVRAGDVLLPRGRRLRPQDLGLMAGLGRTEVSVFRRPKVVVLSTGDEVVPITETPRPGEIRDINSYSLSALVRSSGSEVLSYGIVSDEAHLLRQALEKAVFEGDAVVVSGGSSVGARDLVVEVVASLPRAEVLVHGVAVSPGKPTLLVRVDGKAVFGLPGHPVSAMIVAQVFLVPFLRFIEGEDLEAGPQGRKVQAILATSVASVQGREEYVRVRLEHKDGRLYAWPVFGKSSMLSTMVKSDGFMIVPIHAEGLAQDEMVDVILF
jgi:molybdopterin molybdotransferase